MRGCQLIIVDLIVAGFDVDDEDLARVALLHFGADFVLIQLRPTADDLLLTVARVSHVSPPFTKTDTWKHGATSFRTSAVGPSTVGTTNSRRSGTLQARP